MSQESAHTTDSALLRYMNPVALWTSWLVLIGAVRDQRSLVDAFDTGLYLQWLNGFFNTGSLASSITGEANFLAHHFQPIILLYSPIAALFGRPVVLFLLSVACVFAAWWTGRKFFSKNLRWFNAVFLILIAQPAIAGRIWFSFSPDILAFPAYFWMALQLARPKDPGSSTSNAASIGKQILLWAVMFLLSGLAKETFWLTNAAVALVGVFVLNKSLRLFFVGAALTQVVLFLLLFLWWMPNHSMMPSYYGLSFYLDVIPGVKPSLLDLLTAFLQNFFSIRTLETIFWLLTLMCLLPFLRPSPVWFAAVPGLAAILLARSGQVHHPANHYLIPILPFLLVPVFFAQEQYSALMAKIGRGISPIWVALVPVSFVLFMDQGIIDQITNMATHPQTVHFREDVQLIKVNHLKPDDALVVDGILQPLFYDHTDVTVLLGHTGNPKRLKLNERKRPLTIVTTVDYSKVDDCRTVRIGAGQLHGDYEYFYQLCDLLKTSAETLASYKISGIVVYRLPAGS